MKKFMRVEDANGSHGDARLLRSIYCNHYLSLKKIDYSKMYWYSTPLTRTSCRMDTATPYMPLARPALLTRKMPRASQRAAARNIVAAFKKGWAYVLLVAPMQSGKTGTFQCIARMMLDYGLVDYVYILSGCAEKALEYQAIEDTKKYNRDYMTKGAIQVCFHGDMVRMNKKNININTARTLWILDESHMVQNRNQHVDRFFKRHGLNAYGTTDDMIANETYILSVSATPYSELSSIHYNESRPKYVEELVPGDNYYGVENYWAHGRIHDTFNIMTNKERFLDIIRAKGNAYNLIRCTSRTGLSGDETYAAFLKRLCTDADFKVVFCTTDEDEEQIAITSAEKKYEKQLSLDVKPDQPTIVILKGRLRAGKVVPKEHIGIVWENSKDPNVDTVLQSLLGRMCGYIADQPNKADIYLPPSFMEETKTIIKASHIVKFFFGKDYVPSKATNMKKRRLPSVEGDTVFSTVPIFIDRDVMRTRVPDWDDIIPKNNDDPNKGRYLAAIKEYLSDPATREFINNAPYYTDAQKLEMNKLLDSTSPIYFRGIYTNNAQGKWLTDLKKSVERSECPITPVSNRAMNKAFFMAATPTTKWKDEMECGAEDYGNVWVNVCLKNKNLLPQIAMEARIAKSNDEHIFKVHLDKKTADEIVAIGGVGLRESVCDDPISLKKQMNVYLGWWGRSTMDETAPLVGNSITAVGSHYVGLKRSVYKAGVLDKIKESLEERYGIKMTIDTTTGPHNLICVTKIHWVSV